MVEYALLVALVVLVCLGAINALGKASSGRFSSTQWDLIGNANTVWPN